MTPDHLHATVAVAAMKKGKHVLVHKPLANRMQEGRLVVETARKTKVATHLLAYGAGAGNGLIAERIKEGVIGPLAGNPQLDEPAGVAAIHRDSPGPAAGPQGLRLGPVAGTRAWTAPIIRTTRTRCFAAGTISAAARWPTWAFTALWPVFTALDLGVPAERRGLGDPHLLDQRNVSRIDDNDFSYPTACTIRLRFAARPDRPALDLFWYDGGMKPRLPEEIESQNIDMAQRGHPLRRRPGSDPGRLPRAEPAPVRQGQDAGPCRQKRLRRRTANAAEQRPGHVRLLVRPSKAAAVAGQFSSTRPDHRHGQPGHRRPAGGQEGALRQPEHENHQRGRREQVPVSPIPERLGVIDRLPKNKFITRSIMEGCMVCPKDRTANRMRR